MLPIDAGGVAALFACAAALVACTLAVAACWSDAEGFEYEGLGVVAALVAAVLAAELIFGPAPPKAIFLVAMATPN